MTLVAGDSLEAMSRSDHLRLHRGQPEKPEVAAALKRQWELSTLTKADHRKLSPKMLREAS